MLKTVVNTLFFVSFCLVVALESGLNAAGVGWNAIQESCSRSVVQVFNDVSTFNWNEPYRKGNSEEGRGSGFFVDIDGGEKGVILTNYHVVAESLRIQVQLPSLGCQRFDAEVLSVAPESDLATLRLCPEGVACIEKEFGRVSSLKLGTSDSLKRGDNVFSLGFPLGQEHLKGTQGVISGYENVRFEQNGFDRLCLQTTAPINPGNSGGPTLGSDGKVVGINSAAVMNAQNVGYVIPIDGVKDSLNRMLKSKLVRNPCLGAAVQPMTPTMARALKCPDNFTGIYVVKVIEGCLIYHLGIRSGDVIGELNGLNIDFQGQVSAPWSDERVNVSEVFDRVPVNQLMTCKVCRNGKIISLTGEKKLVGMLPIRPFFPRCEQIDYEVFGGGLVVMPLSVNRILQLREHNPTLLAHLVSQNVGTEKLVVSYVLPTSKASDPRGQLRMGTIITHVNNKEVTNLNQFRVAINDSLKNSEFITITSDTGAKDSFESRCVLVDELRLSKIFSYPREHSVGLRLAESVPLRQS